MSNIAQGQKLSFSRAKERWNKGSYVQAASELVGGAIGQLVGNIFGVSASNVDDFMHDGSVSGGGKPMTVSASKVTPINDGSVSGAISDPNDHAIFAKVGGPFDKLFNGVFKQVNALYQGILGGKNNVVPREPLGNNSEFAASDSLETFRRTISEAKNNAQTNNTNGGNSTFKVEITG